MNEKEMTSELTQFLGEKSKVKSKSEIKYNLGNKLTKGKLKHIFERRNIEVGLYAGH